MKKRIISLFLALMVVFSACFISTTLVSADVVESTLTLDSSSTARRLIFTGTDSVSISGITKKFAPATASDGVIVNSVMNSDLKFYKSSGKWNLYLAENAVADTTVTVVGTFTYSTTSVKFATITLIYNGTAWAVTENPDIATTEYNRSFTLQYANDEVKYGTSGGIFLSSDDTLDYDSNWNTFISFDEGDNNGVFLNGTKTSVQMKKIDQFAWYVCLSDAAVTAVTDDVVNIKGSITHNGKTAIFGEISLKFNGTTWEVNVEYEICDFELCYTNDDIKYGNEKGVYLKSDDSIEYDATWNTAIAFNQDDDSGVFFNGTKIDVKMKKYASTEWYVGISDVAITATKGDIVTVKGKISYKGVNVTFNEISVVFNGSTWALTDDPNLETGRTLSLDTQLGNPATSIWLIGDDGLTAPGWETKILNDGAEDSGVFFNGTKTAVALKKYDGKKWYVGLVDENITATNGDTVIIKGIFYHGNYRIAFNEVEFKFNGTTWEEVTDTQVVSLDIVDLLSISKFNTETNKWELYFSTTTVIPGVDETTTFDVLMKVGSKNKTITCKKSSLEHSLAFEIDSSLIPQSPASEVSLTIMGGKYDIKNENVKIKLESNTVVYFANGLVSLVSSNLNIDEKDIALTIDRTMQGGGNKNGIYLTATDNVPYDENWETVTTACEGKTNGVFLNGIKTDAFFKKFAADKYYVCLVDVNVVPEDGDIIVIKGAFKTNNYVSSYKEYILTFEDGTWVDSDTPETNYTKVVIDSYDANVSEFNNELNRWHLYFYTKDMLPGNADQEFNSVKVKIGDAEYSMPCYHAGYKDTFFLIIDSDKLGKDQKATVEVSGKAKSNDQLIGMDVQKFTFYVNKYGVSLDGYLSPVEVSESDVVLTLDTTTAGWTGGTNSGIYLYTKDNFEVDKTWATTIRAISYDDNSGIFLNGVKINAILKKYEDGQIYVGLIDAGIVAKDKDKVTIKGTFALNGYAVSYKELTLYYNGQSWAKTYKAPIPKTTVKLTPTGIKASSTYSDDHNAWQIFVKIEEEIPGTNNYEFKTLSYVINGKTYETSVYRIDDTLLFYVPNTVLPKNTKDGTAIKLKAGVASDHYNLYDIKLVKDCTAYTFQTGVSDKKPTNNTNYLNLDVPGLFRPITFNEDLNAWQIFFKVEQEFDVDDGAKYYNLPVKINGKEYEDVSVYRGGVCLYILVPASVVPKDAKSATLTIAKGAKGITNAGWNGICLKNEVKAYLFNGVWNDVNFTKIQNTDLTLEHLNFANYNSDAKRWDIYVNVNTEIPGKNWFEEYHGLTVYLNGKKFTTYADKADSENNRLLYLSLTEETFGKFKDGDIIYVPKNNVGTCGGYQITITRDFYLQYINGTWLEYYESDVKAPKAEDTIWENSRIDGYIPVQEKDGIMFTNVEPTNVIKSIEDKKDVTVKFTTKKMLAYNEDLPTNSIILRGQPLTEGMDVSETALYGYNIAFNYVELTEDHAPNNPELWGVHSQQISVWKNGINYSLLDQYRLNYNWVKENHPFFEYGKEYEYTISIYNVAEDICVIEIYCNGEIIMRTVDYGSEDPLDPVYNAGETRIYASCPQYLNSPEVELDNVIASQTECYLGEQVRVSSTYPAILDGSEYTVEGDGAKIKDGVFTATKEGTYTVYGKFNGKDKGSVQIKVTKKPSMVTAVEETSEFPIIPVAIGGGVLLLIAAAVVIILLKKKKSKKTAE